MGIITDIIKGIPVNAIQRDKLEKLEKRHDELETENTQLREENRELKSKLEGLTSTSELGENEIKILILLASRNKPIDAQMIAAILGLSLTKTKYYLEKMWRQYVNSHDWSNDRQSEYFLAQGGREYLVENDLVE